MLCFIASILALFASVDRAMLNRWSSAALWLLASIAIVEIRCV